MADEEKRVPAAFFKSDSGNEPVRDWLKELSKDDRKVIGADIMTLECGWPIGMPLCKPMVSHKGLWEIRTNLSGKRKSRILFCVYNGQLLLLHGFIKKAQKTPKTDLDLAAKRMKQLNQKGKKK